MKMKMILKNSEPHSREPLIQKLFLLLNKITEVMILRTEELEIQ
jgi:hypothetical protein